MSKCDRYYVAFEVCRLDTNLRFQTDEPEEAIEVFTKWKEKDNPDIDIRYYYAPNTIEIGNPLYNAKELSNWSTEENPIVMIKRIAVPAEKTANDFLEETKRYFPRKSGLFSRLMIDDVLNVKK